jgi:two-component system, OmpR family, response regulator
MLPASLAMVDDDPAFCEVIAQTLSAFGVQTTVFNSSNELLAHPDAYDFKFYLIDLMLPGIDGVALIDVLRRRTNVGVVVVTGRLAADTFKHVVDAGGDMYLAKPVQAEQVLAAVRAVQRRAVASGPAAAPWRLDRRARRLIAPDGAPVELSDIDFTVLQCLLEAQGEPVTREALCQRLGRHPDADTPDGLNAVVYRLRRRIERATPLQVPLHSKTRVGYVFKAQLTAY